uniref:Peptidase S1 domain-containing protein n=1 Tax=Romanomermis culicivorax TaxID=13658 RepID=A0A915JPA1_ROMCU
MADKSSIWALSAKHCLVNDLSNDDSDRKIDLTHFGFLFGVHDLRFATQYAVYRTIAEIFLHSDQGTKLNDLALIKLAKQVKFNSYINGLCLPDSSEKVESYNSASCVTCGFGATKVGGTSPVGSKIIQCINFEAQPLDSDRGLSFRDGNSMGDSGSPIFCRTKHPWLFLFAVVIGGQSIVFKRAYVMAARISYFMNYIDENMNRYNGCLHPCLTCCVGQQVYLLLAAHTYNVVEVESVMLAFFLHNLFAYTTTMLPLDSLKT